MTVEEKLKDLILSRYGSIRVFTIEAEIAYSTFDSMLKRGIQNSTIANVLKVCKKLNISADALSRGEIVSNKLLDLYEDEKPDTDITTILANTRQQLLSTNGLMFNGKPADDESVQSILNAMEVGLEIAKRKNKK